VDGNSQIKEDATQFNMRALSRIELFRQRRQKSK